MFKTIKEEMALTKRTMNAAIEVKTRLFYRPIERKIQGFDVIVDSAAIHQFGCEISMAMLMSDGTTRIYVDSTFIEMPPHIQLFILHHEQAHIDLGHITPERIKSMGKRRVLMGLLGMLIIEEIDANKRAYQQVGTVIAFAALDYMRQNLSSYFAKREMNKHYNLVRSYPFAHQKAPLNKLCPGCKKEMPLGLCIPCTDRYFDEAEVRVNQRIQNFVKGEN